MVNILIIAVFVIAIGATVYLVKTTPEPESRNRCNKNCNQGRTCNCLEDF